MIDLHNSGILTEAEGVAKIKVVQVLFSLVHFILNRKTNFSESLQIYGAAIVIVYISRSIIIIIVVVVA